MEGNRRDQRRNHSPHRNRRGHRLRRVRTNYHRRRDRIAGSRSRSTLSLLSLGLDET